MLGGQIPWEKFAQAPTSKTFSSGSAGRKVEVDDDDEEWEDDSEPAHAGSSNGRWDS